MAKVLQDKIAIVTGSDSRIGQATAEEFAKEGADVVVTCFRDQDGAEETRRRVEAAGRRARSAADRALAQPAGPGAAASSASMRRPPGGFRGVRPPPPRAAPDSWPPSAASAAELGTVRGIPARDGRRSAHGRHHTRWLRSLTSWAAEADAAAVELRCRCAVNRGALRTAERITEEPKRCLESRLR